MTKETILAAVQALPEPIALPELDSLMEKLVSIAKVEEGLRQSEAGDTMFSGKSRAPGTVVAQVRWANEAMADLA